MCVLQNLVLEAICKSKVLSSLLALSKEGGLIRETSPGSSQNPSEGLEVSQYIISFEIGTYAKAESTDFVTVVPAFVWPRPDPGTRSCQCSALGEAEGGSGQLLNPAQTRRSC